MRERERSRFPTSGEPDKGLYGGLHTGLDAGLEAGLSPTTLRTWPEPEPRVRCLIHCDIQVPLTLSLRGKSQEELQPA